MKVKLFRLSLIMVLALSLSGCTFIFQRGRRSDVQKIEELSHQLDELNQTKQLLEGRLSQEIQDKQVSLNMMEKGLVITFVADVLFDSGKVEIRPEAYPILDKVVRVLKENVPELNIGIEGHTDNEPIVHSGWKDNWQLSSERALSILRYLSQEKGIAPSRLESRGYGEFHPVATNDTPEGRKLNRRVEVVILPAVTKIKEAAKTRKHSLREPKENLK